MHRSDKDKPQGFLTRLRKDNRGNTLFIVAASMIPLLGMIGSGLDMARAYMAKQKLQEACDAGALAGRRIMTNDTVNSTVVNEAKKFFFFNFPLNTYDTATFTPAVTRAGQGIVQVKADTTIPMAIMQIFGIRTLPLSVTCTASQDFENTDIVLVLDVTGSMNDYVSGARKIDSLRAAVLALYDQLKPVQDQLEANGMRLRYGIVPYSSGVNVGKAIYDENPAYIANSAPYYSRKPNWVNQAGVDRNTCMNAYQYGAYYQNVKGLWWQNNNTCWGYFDVSYTQQPVDTSTYKTFQPTDISKVIGNDMRYFSQGGPRVGDDSRFNAAINVTWQGCIEERQTTSTITASSGYTIPDAAYDLDIDMIPTSDPATQWKPMWPEIEYRVSNGNRESYACPVAAKRLTAWSRSDLSNYLNTLTPAGSTYHDFGMIWGARFISPTGIFKSANPTNPAANDPDNPTMYNGMRVNKYVIFMTDGLPDPDPYVYGLYGQEIYDKRVTGGYTNEADQVNRHQQRLAMACNAAKGMNVSIWVVGFSTTLNSTLQTCASSSDQASTSSTSSDLIDKFTEIGQRIGALRLTK